MLADGTAVCRCPDTERGIFSGRQGERPGPSGAKWREWTPPLPRQRDKRARRRFQNELRARGEQSPPDEEEEKASVVFSSQGSEKLILYSGGHVYLEKSFLSPWPRGVPRLDSSKARGVIIVVRPLLFSWRWLPFCRRRFLHISSFPRSLFSFAFISGCRRILCLFFFSSFFSLLLSRALPFPLASARSPSAWRHCGPLCREGFSRSAARVGEISRSKCRVPPSTQILFIG